MSKRLSILFDKTLNFFAVIGAVFGVILMLAIVTDVIMRYFFNKPSGWIVEYSEYGLLFITFLPAAWVLREGRHVKLDLVLDHLSSSRIAFLNMVTSFLAGGVFLIFTWFAITFTWEIFESGLRMVSSTRPYKWPIQVAIPVGCVLVTIQFFRLAVNNLNSFKASLKTKR